MGKPTDWSRLTDDLERGLYPPAIEDKGLGNFTSGFVIALSDNELETEESIFEVKTGEIKGCSESVFHEELPVGATVPQIKKFLSYVNRYRYLIALKGSPTACLFRLAEGIYYNLRVEIFDNYSSESYFMLFEILIEIRNIIEARTKNPYRLYFEELSLKEIRKPLPKTILTRPPLDNYESWKKILQSKKSILKGKVKIIDPIPILESTEESNEQIDGEELKAFEDDTRKNILQNFSAQRFSIIEEYINVISSISIKDINAHSRQKIKMRESTKLSDIGEIILYHSVFTVVLDSKGNIDDFYGPMLGPYSMYVPTTGEFGQTVRSLPPEGFYINIDKYNDYKIDKKSITEIVGSGIGGITQYGNGQTWTSEYHERLQTKIDGNGLRFLSSIVVKSAFNRESLTWRLVKKKLPQLINITIPYLMDEFNRKANLKNIASDVWDAIKEEIIEILIERTLKYVTIRIASKFIPVVNAGFAVYDIVEGEDDRKRFWQALACAKLGLQGIVEDDMIIAAKVLAKVLADQFYDELIGFIVAKAWTIPTQKSPPSPTKPTPVTDSNSTAVSLDTPDSSNVQTSPKPAPQPPPIPLPHPFSLPTNSSVPPKKPEAADSQGTLGENGTNSELDKESNGSPVEKGAEERGNGNDKSPTFDVNGANAKEGATDQPDPQPHDRATDPSQRGVPYSASSLSGTITSPPVSPVVKGEPSTNPKPPIDQESVPPRNMGDVDGDPATRATQDRAIGEDGTRGRDATSDAIGQQPIEVRPGVFLRKGKDQVDSPAISQTDRGLPNRPEISAIPPNSTIQKISFDPHAPNFLDKYDAVVPQPPIVLEFPDGTRVWRDPHSRVVMHETTLGPRPGRQGTESANYTASDHGGLPKGPKYERAHTLGQTTGTESPFAIWYAPRFVNQNLQNLGIERYMRSLADNQLPNTSYRLVTETAAHPDSSRLSRISYRVEIMVNGQPHPFFDYGIHITGTAEHPHIVAKRISFADNPVAQAHRQNVKIPEILGRDVDETL